MNRLGVILTLAQCLVFACGALGAEEPYSCKEFREAQKKCSYNSVGPCYVARDMERYRQQCIRDGGKP